MTHKLLLLTSDNQKYQQLIEQCQLPNLTIVDEQPQHICEANIWLAEPKLAAPLLPMANKLTWLQSTFAGVDALCKPRSRQDYQLTNNRGIFGPLMSEYLFGYLLSHHRSHSIYKQQQTHSLWQPSSFKSLKGQHLLLLGTGSIAQHLALTARHFGMKVSAINQSGQASSEFDYVDILPNIDQYLPLADVIASVLPDTVVTTNILNKQRLSLLKPDAILFNLGRGNVLDLEALYAQLMQQPMQHAILDVFNNEPLPSVHPIWQLENATITPHIAAPSLPEQIVEIFIKNYMQYSQQQPLDYLVDFKKGY